MPRLRCFSCRRPQVRCYCAELRPIACDTRIVILSHQREDRKATSSGRLTHRSLINSDYQVGFHFDDEAMRKNLLDCSRNSFLLFPTPDAMPLENIAGNLPLVQTQILVIEATWAMARHIYRHTPWLQDLPKVTFSRPIASHFRIRKQPRHGCLATIEAVHRTLRTLEDGDQKKLDHMLKIFDEANDFQIRHGASTAVG